MADPTAQSDPAGYGDLIREQDKIMLVLAYFSIFSLIPLLTVRDSEYVRWHAKQGLALAVLGFAWSVVGALLIFVLPRLMTCLYPLVGLGFLVLSVMGIVKAFGPQRWRIPVAAALADRF